MSVLQKLTEGVISRDLSRENHALLTKWEKTGLLEGLGDERKRQGMAVLLENQAKELLREASSMAAGDVEGFAAVAFPIVRRVFGGLVANDLVSVQPMSLPSGLIFFLDFQHSGPTRLGSQASGSLYGGNVVGRQLTGGVTLGADPGGFYDMGHGFSSAQSSSLANDLVIYAMSTAMESVTGSAMSQAQKKMVDFDPDILADTVQSYTQVAVTTGTSGVWTNFHRKHVAAITATLALANKTALADGHQPTIVRRLTKIVKGTEVANSGGGGAVDHIVFTFRQSRVGDGNSDGGSDSQVVKAGTNLLGVSVPQSDGLAEVQGGVGAVVGQPPWQLEGAGAGDAATSPLNTADVIPEIDIKVDSIAVTAVTKKLKARWTPELGQDLNAYHNLDAEVELTGILSEQIALEIDRELLNELVQGATASTRYWSRAPGLFLDSNGSELGASSAAPDFTGTVSEWYETLIETINDVSAQIHRKTLRGGANFVVCSPEVANILEFTSGFRASITADQDRGTIGAVKAGSLSKKFDVYVDPYFLRNVCLVGRKGSSFLESGFVYAPYVPLQVTPTIFGQEDFVPRKGVMTRYAKKMVRPDMYGLVIVRGLLGEEMPS